jgi:hypothetical protein
MKRVVQAVLIVVVIISGIMLCNLLREAQWAHSWVKTVLVMLPEVGTVIAVFELHHSAKANELRKERNELAKNNNDLEDARNTLMEKNNAVAQANNKLTEQNTELQRRLDTQRNEHLAEIAKQVQRPQTVAERNATKLRPYIGSPVTVLNSDDSRWGGSTQIAEIAEDNILALFQPMQQGSQAFVVYADCGELEVLEIARGACPIQIKLNKRYGASHVPLGEVTRWENRRTPAATPRFDRGGTAINARYSKPGSSETRTASIYSSKDGSNSFLLETSSGEQLVGDNKVVSIRFLSLQVGYYSEGFQRMEIGNNPTTFRLFVC